MFYLFWILFFSVCVYLVVVANPLHPIRDGGNLGNIWTWIGLGLLIIGFTMSYNYLAGVPALLSEHRATPFRPVDDLKWSVSLPASALELSDQEKQDLEDDAQAIDTSVPITEFNLEKVDIQIKGSWLPISWLEPRFYVVDMFFKGKVTPTAGGTPVERTVTVSSVCSSNELGAFLERFRRNRVGASPISGTAKAYGRLQGGSGLPGRLKN